MVESLLSKVESSDVEHNTSITMENTHDSNREWDSKLKIVNSRDENMEVYVDYLERSEKRQLFVGFKYYYLISKNDIVIRTVKDPRVKDYSLDDSEVDVCGRLE